MIPGARHYIACAIGLVLTMVLVAGCGDDVEPLSEDVEPLSEEQSMQRELDLFEQQILEHENAIASCMAEHGFEYVAELPPDWIAERATAEAVFDGHVDPQSVAQATFDAEVAAGNTNDSHFSTLGEADRLAFEQAYNGSSEQPGCYDATYASVWNADSDEIVLDERTFDELVSGSSGEAEALADYERCMAERGFVVSGRNQIHEQMYEQRQIIVHQRPENVTLDAAIAEYNVLANVAREANVECGRAYQNRLFEIIDEKLTAIHGGK